MPLMKTWLPLLVLVLTACGSPVTAQPTATSSASTVATTTTLPYPPPVAYAPTVPERTRTTAAVA